MSLVKLNYCYNLILYTLRTNLFGKLYWVKAKVILLLLIN